MSSLETSSGVGSARQPRLDQAACADIAWGARPASAARRGGGGPVPPDGRGPRGARDRVGAVRVRLDIAGAVSIQAVNAHPPAAEAGRGRALGPVGTPRAGPVWPSPARPWS